MEARDLRGYAGAPPHPHWPNDARIAVQFVLNIEEGGESSLVNGEPQSEAYLHELPGRPAYPQNSAVLSPLSKPKVKTKLAQRRQDAENEHRFARIAEINLKHAHIKSF